MEKASEVVGQQINGEKLVERLSKHEAVMAKFSFAAYLPNDYEEEDTREEDAAVIANAQPLETLGRVLTIL